MKEVEVGVEVRAIEGKGQGLVATRRFEAGETVLACARVAVAEARHAHSIQYDWAVHIDIAPPADMANHACDPNIGLRNNTLGAYDYVALRSIEVGEEVCFHYGMSEYAQMELDACGCGSSLCAGRVLGYSALDEATRRRFGGLVADYLKTDPPT